ncbi:effector protein Tle3 domain-containing protein [Paraburkholderia sp. J69-1]|uniref:effector protein Tle3 domain-containing protein n=1 Tax=Paraburkholderia sp. J69-1 TaxID=2805436 RepID=UPI002AB60DE4|nr:DUF3274 domain-containing protein [Paraburkholderia sp. J69-1]
MWKETPNEAKLHFMNEKADGSSYHSAVMSGELNHRCATAFDVSLGQARAIDDANRAFALRGIADWRISVKQVQQMSKGAYDALDPITKQYAEATTDYKQKGDFPSETLVPEEPPDGIGVVSERRSERNKALTDALAKDPMNSVPLP